MSQKQNFVYGWQYRQVHQWGAKSTTQEVDAAYKPLICPASFPFEENSTLYELEKTFAMPTEWQNKQIYLSLQGAFGLVRAFLNGVLLQTKQSATSCLINLSPMLAPNTTNQLHLFVASSEPAPFVLEEIVVSLHERLHIAPYGVSYQVQEGDEEDGAVELRMFTNVINDTPQTVQAKITHSVTDPHGKKMLKRTISITMPPFACHIFEGVINIPKPVFWCIENPVCYQVQTDLLEKSKVLESHDSQVGLRILSAHVSQGIIDSRVPFSVGGIEEGIFSSNRLSSQLLFEKNADHLTMLGVNTLSLPLDSLTEKRLAQLDELGISAIIRLSLSDFDVNAWENMVYTIQSLRHHPSMLMWQLPNIPIPETKPNAWLWGKILHLLQCIDSQHLTCAEVDETISPLDARQVDVLLWRGNPAECGIAHTQFPQKPILLYLSRKSHFMPAYYATQKKYIVGQLQAHLPSQQFFDFESLKIKHLYPRLAEQMEACYQTKTPVLYVQTHKQNQQDPLSLHVFTNCDTLTVWVDGRQMTAKGKAGVAEYVLSLDEPFGYVQAVGFRRGKEVIRKEIEPNSNPYALSITPVAVPSTFKKDDIIILMCSVLDTEGREVEDVCEPIEIKLEGGVKFDQHPAEEKSLFGEMKNGRLPIVLQCENPEKRIAVSVASSRFVPTKLPIK